MRRKDDMMETGTETAPMRELDARSRDGICVRLLWEPATDELFVAVEDERTGDRFQVRVGADDAVDAFAHPYGYERRGGRWGCVAWEWD
jgi:hypothetical protein